MFNTFIHELALKTLPKDERTLDIRYSMANFVYNAVLGEGLKRLALIKQSKNWKRAKKLPKSKERTKLFKEAFLKYKISDYDLQKFAIKVKNASDIKNHLDTHSVQKLATRAYNSVSDYAKGRRGKPRFKTKNRLRSIEGKNSKSGIRFRKHKVYWKGLELDVIFDIKDKYGLQAHALSCKIKYCRIVRKRIKEKYYYFIQLVLEGSFFIKHKVKNASVGLDIGPSSLAASSEEKALLTPFCKELDKHYKNIRLRQRKMDRSLRSMNKDNYNDKGMIKKKKLTWVKSANYKKLQVEISEYYRKLSEYRKRLHGKLANEIICDYGNIIKTEKISYKGWQKLYGKSINFRSPSKFISMLSYKAEKAGGFLEEFSTKKTCLSQICLCGIKQQKPLSQRWHECRCGIKKVQRDLFSAFLARYVKNDCLDINQAKEAWPGAHPLLEQAISRLNKTASGKSRLASFGLNQSQSGLFAKDKSIINKAKNVVRI